MIINERTYTSDDVARWDTAYHEAVDRSVAKIRTGYLDEGHELADLARRHECLGLTAIAKSEWGRALGHFGATVEAWVEIFTRERNGEVIDQSLTAIVPPGLFLLANACSEEVVEHLADATDLAANASVNNNAGHYLGLVIRDLSMGRIDAARHHLIEAPKVLRHQRPFLRALTAVATLNDHDFMTAMDEEVEAWQKRVKREKLERLPDAVCFHHGIGWLKLAAKVWRRQVDVAIDKVPQEILSVTAEPVPLGI